MSRAHAINEAGLVVGDIGANNIAASWTASSGLNVIGALAGLGTACCSELFDVNVHGVAVGNSIDVFGIGVMVWSQATNTSTGLHATTYGDNSRARGTNDAGDIAGHVDGGVPFFKPNGGPFVLLPKAPFATDSSSA